LLSFCEGLREGEGGREGGGGEGEKGRELEKGEGGTNLSERIFL
jgi:hypothetical protein